MALADINWSAHLSATGGNVTPGYGACRDALGIGYVVATAANLIAAGGMLEGIFLTAGAPSGTAQIQVTGPLDRTITGLGPGTVTTVGLDPTGAMVRDATPVIAVCNQWGDAVLTPGASPDVVAIVLATAATSEFADVLAGSVDFNNVILNEIMGGSCAGTIGAAKVVQLDGDTGVLPVVATEVDSIGDTNCTAMTFIGSYLTTDATQSNAFESPDLTSGTWKVNIALVADMDNAADGGGWDISFTFKATGVNTAAIAGSVPGNVPPDDGSGGVSTLRATVAVIADTFVLKVTGDPFTNVTFGYVVQIITAIQ